MSFALDVNVLVHAVNSGSPRHAAAAAFLERCANGSEVMGLGWITLMGFVRITTNPAILGAPLSHAEAMERVDALLDLPHVKVLGEEDGFWRTYREVTEDLPIRGKLVPDAHLAALLRQHGVDTLYTSDTDFRKFRFLKVLDPFTAAAPST